MAASRQPDDHGMTMFHGRDFTPQPEQPKITAVRPMPPVVPMPDMNPAANYPL